MRHTVVLISCHCAIFVASSATVGVADSIAFHETCGVGSDGNAISTIDPQGIALAAIMQIRRKSTELKEQVEKICSLRAEVE